MRSGHSSTKNRFFVPLGRQRGGYLDFLGLPPNATEAQAGMADRAKRRDLESEFKSQRKELKAKREAGKLTEEQLVADEETLKSVKEEGERKLNELKQAYDKTLAERKRQARSGHIPVETGWRDVCPDLMKINGNLRDFILKSRPIGEVAKADLEHLLVRWFADGDRRGSESDASGSDESVPSRADAGQLQRVLRDRDLLQLLAADAMWSRLSGTNRNYWIQQMDQWLEDVKRIQPKFNASCTTGGDRGFAAYQQLGHPPQLTLGELDLSIDSEPPTVPAQPQGDLTSNAGSETR